MGRDERDPYSVLGLGRNASASEIRRAYRRAARETHPDSRREDPSAADRFAGVSAAYETLRDPSRRAGYDRAHPLAPPAKSAARGRAPVWAGSIEVAVGRRRSRMKLDQDVGQLAHALSRLLRAFRSSSRADA